MRTVWLTLHEVIMKSQTFTIKISAQSILDENELRDIVGKEKFDKIKAEKPGGIFKSWVLFHEGSSRVKTPSGQKVIKWGREAVKASIDKIKPGIKFFLKHNSDNSTDNRKEYGEVVGSAEREVGDRLNSIVIGHFPKETAEAAKKAESISMEAIWNYIEEVGQYLAEGIENITGIALGMPNSTPGFPEANELVTVQAFPEQKGTKRTKRRTRMQANEGEIDYENMDFFEIKRIVKRLQIFPTQLYDPEQIIGRRTVSKNGSVSYSGGDRNLHEYLEDKFFPDTETQVKEYQTKITDLECKYSDASMQLTRYTAVPKLEEKAKEMELPQSIVNLAKANIERFQPNDNMDESIGKFLKDTQKEAERLQGLGFAFAENNSNNGNNNNVNNNRTELASARPALGATTDTNEANPFLPKNERGQ